MSVAAGVDRDETALRRIIDDRFVFNRSNGRTSGNAALMANILELQMTGRHSAVVSRRLARAVNVDFNVSECPVDCLGRRLGRSSFPNGYFGTMSIISPVNATPTPVAT
jgi:hypothetical protein